MYSEISFTLLNDFIFCPVSIYFHQLERDLEVLTFQDNYQLNGTKAHESIDEQKYSDKKNVLQGINVYSSKYNLIGKIDLYNGDKKELIERKNYIAKIYDGYVFQLYAQYYSMIEMGYEINKLTLHSYKDNKNYLIPLPEEDTEMKKKFEQTILEIQNFSFINFTQDNKLKCKQCIYAPMCSYFEENDNE